MKPEIKKLWLEALRSGKYKQGCGALKRLDKDPNTGLEEFTFCCLGVLCDLYDKTHKEDNWQILKHRDKELSHLGGWGFPHRIVVEWSGLPDCWGGIVVDEHDLTELNDGEGCKRMSFLQIADIIEDKL